MKKTILIIAIALVSCTDNKTARKVLEEQGYTNIRFTGYKCFACSEDDLYSTGFVATSVAGKEVRGTVCGGILKGHTIRID